MADLLSQYEQYKESEGKPSRMPEQEYRTVLKDVSFDKSQAGNDQFIFKFKITDEGEFEGETIIHRITIAEGNAKFKIGELCAIVVMLGGERLLEGKSHYKELQKVFIRLDDLKPAKARLRLYYKKETSKYYDIEILAIEPVLAEVAQPTKATAPKAEPAAAKKAETKKEKAEKPAKEESFVDSIAEEPVQSNEETLENPWD